MNENKLLEIIGSKWFLLGLGIAMIVVLPVTYGNFMVVYQAGQMSRLWYIPVIFIVNLLTVLMTFYKVAGMFFKKKDPSQEDWEDE